jgi:hypothetical protein
VGRDSNECPGSLREIEGDLERTHPPIPVGMGPIDEGEHYPTPPTRAPASRRRVRWRSRCWP